MKAKGIFNIIVCLTILSSVSHSYAQSVPTNISGKAQSESSIRISWVGTGDAFNILRSMDGKTFSNLTTVDGNTFSFTDTELSASTPYLYKIC